MPFAMKTDLALRKHETLAQIEASPDFCRNRNEYELCEESPNKLKVVPDGFRTSLCGKMDNNDLLVEMRGSRIYGRLWMRRRTQVRGKDCGRVGRAVSIYNEHG
jgi:hypothetical protein